MSIKYNFGKITLSIEERKLIEKKIKQVEGEFDNLKEDELKIDFKINQDRRYQWRIVIDIKTPSQSFRVEKNGFEFRTVLDKVAEVILRQIRQKKGRIRSF